MTTNPYSSHTTFMGLSVSVSSGSKSNKRFQTDSQHYAIFALLAVVQTITQKLLRTSCG